MIVSSRIDSRLIHGQVTEAWVPHLRVKRLLVADDRSSTDPMAQTAMGLAVPDSVMVLYRSISSLDLSVLHQDSTPTLVLFRDVSAALVAREKGLPNGRLVLGNIHSGPGREPLSRSVFLTNEEQQRLSELSRSGMDVVIQALPTDSAIAFPPNA